MMDPDGTVWAPYIPIYEAPDLDLSQFSGWKIKHVKDARLARALEGDDMARGLERLDKPLHFKRVELINRLKENREKHLNDFESAMPVWRREMAEALSELAQAISEPDEDYENVSFEDINDLRKAKPFRKPQDYDRAIAMLEMATESEIELDTHAFRQLVLDEWDWKGLFHANTVSYSSRAV